MLGKDEKGKAMAADMASADPKLNSCAAPQDLPTCAIMGTTTIAAATSEGVRMEVLLYWTSMPLNATATATATSEASHKGRAFMLHRRFALAPTLVFRSSRPALVFRSSISSPLLTYAVADERGHDAGGDEHLRGHDDLAPGQGVLEGVDHVIEELAALDDLAEDIAASEEEEGVPRETVRLLC